MAPILSETYWWLLAAASRPDFLFPGLLLPTSEQRSDILRQKLFPIFINNVVNHLLRNLRQIGPLHNIVDLLCPEMTCAGVADGKSDPKISLCSTPYSIADMKAW